MEKARLAIETGNRSSQEKLEKVRQRQEIGVHGTGLEKVRLSTETGVHATGWRKPTIDRGRKSEFTGQVGQNQTIDRDRKSELTGHVGES